MKKKISVASTCFNHSKYLKTWFDGISSQELPDGYELEVNVVIDSDKYDLLSLNNIIEKSNINFNVWFNHINKGGPQSLTQALSMCTGEFIAILECDDFWKPGKLSKSLDFMSKGGFDAIFTEVEAILPSGRVVEQAWKSMGIYVPAEITFDLLRQGNRCYTCSSLFRSECFDYAPTPKEFEKSFKFLGDFPRILWLLKNGFRVGYLDEPLSVYRDSIGVNNKTPGESAKYDVLVREWASLGCPKDGWL